jgi:hypothetical protein
MTVVKIWGREPAVILAFVAALIQGVSGFFFHLTVDQQGVLNAVAVAVLGLVTAAAVKGDAWLPAISGLIKAVLALGVAFGAHWPADKQSLVMVLVTAAFAAFVRTQVTAPVNAAGGTVSNMRAA